MTMLTKLISEAIASGRSAIHEVAPEDFGPDTSRWSMLADCLAGVLERHPELTVSLSGSSVALAQFGLKPSSIEPVGRFLVTVRPGPTDRVGAVRIAFTGQDLPVPPESAGREETKRADDVRRDLRTALSKDPRHWRLRAEETRARAEQIKDLSIRLQMEGLAGDYEAMAARIEERLAREKR